MNRVAKLLVAAAGALLVGSAPAVAINANCPGPDTFGHVCSTPLPADCALLPTPNLVTNTGDDTNTPRPIGFTARHYGVPFTTVGVTTNGFLNVGAGIATTFTNNCPLSATAANNIIAGLWDDWDLSATTGGGGSITDGTSGIAPNRIYSVTWNVPRRLQVANRVIFQVQIHENGGCGERVRVILSSITGTLTQYSATTGIENLNGTDTLMMAPCNSAALAPFCIDFSVGAVPETTNAACHNGSDDDCDGLTDCLDPNCAAVAPETTLADCRNGLDDDCDGLSDCADPGCAATIGPEICTNTVDDDCDGLVNETCHAICPGPDAFGHVCQEPACTGCSIRPTPNVITTTGDDTNFPRPVGFTTNFYGVPYSTVGVVTNGFLNVGAGTATALTNACPLSASTTHSIIAGLWEDWNFNNGGGTLSDGLGGTAPWRVYSVTWNNVPTFATTGGIPNARATFQIQIHENGGLGERVVVIVQSVTGLISSTTGIKDTAAAARSLQRQCSSVAVAVAPFCVSFTGGPQPTSEAGACNDGVDNDCDGVADGCDPDCTTFTPENTVARCHDGVDNDCDNIVDCLDPDCANVAPESSPGACANGVDDDCDGLTDCADPACVGLAAERCDDSIDNDCDGLINENCKAICPGPDAFGHACSAPCTGTRLLNTVNVVGSGDDIQFARPIGFTATLYGQVFSVVNVVTNGYLNVASTQSLANQCPFTSTAPNNVIAGVWDDLLVAAASPVTDGTFGSAPNRVYAATWRDVPRFGDATARITMQIQIHENDSGLGERFVVIVQSTTGTSWTSTTGLENVDGSQSLTFQCATLTGALAPFAVAFQSGPQNTTEAGGCGDSLDNDCDGLVDCFDPDCPPAPPEGGIQCRDGFDNDCDGAIDCADSSCFNNTDTPEAPTRCFDGLENDCDNLIDCEDPDCFDNTNTPEAPTRCHDGVENDCDGATDCADTDCLNANPEICVNGVDDDCDGQADCDDADCFRYQPELSCENNLDDNCDRLIDCDDPDCSEFYGCVAIQNLGALEAKLDERAAALAALETRLDQPNMDCEIIRLLHTPNGQRTSECGGQSYTWNGGP